MVGQRASAGQNATPPSYPKPTENYGPQTRRGLAPTQRRGSGLATAPARAGRPPERPPARRRPPRPAARPPARTRHDPPPPAEAAGVARLGGRRANLWSGRWSRRQPL